MATDFYIPYAVSKPARYTGIERNAVFKNPESIKVRFALCYPDIYEVGMSYYGYFLLYELANTVDEVWCERCFAPWVDMEEYLRKSRIPLFTLESKTPLFRMDMVGFSLTYELNITNILNMLELGGIRVRAEERTQDPIVIAGGPSMMNPTPYEPFFDIIVIGEGENSLLEILKKFKELKGLERSQIVRELSALQGVYSPLFRKQKVTRLYIRNLNDSFHPTEPPVPVVGSIHDRLNIEVSRGCGNGCRFCAAGYIYRPYRERNFETVRKIIDNAIQKTGYEEISLLSLSSGDHSELLRIISYVAGRYPGVSVSLPSLKIGTLSDEEISAIGKIARTGFTFALEAPSERIRNMLNKNIDLESFHRQIPLLKSYGWRYLKIYLMIGFPWEKEEDLQELLPFLNPLMKKGIQVHLAVSPFIPKPHTPFQYLPMDNEENLVHKINIIKGLLKGKNVKLSYRDIKQSFAEAIISRGDWRLSSLFTHLRKEHTRFEAWREFFNFEKYINWFQSSGIDMRLYLGERKLNEVLPWDFIDSGIEKRYLITEYRKSESGITTVSCHAGCSSCGLSKEKCFRSSYEHSGYERELLIRKESRDSKKITFRFGKLGKAKYIGHLDAIKSLIRALRSSGLLIRTHGKYHPLPRVSISQAIPLGLESTCEYLTAELLECDYDFRTLLKLINRSLPKGMKILEIFRGDGGGSISNAVLIVSRLNLEGENFELMRERDGKKFYLLRSGNIREILKTDAHERIIKIREDRVHGLRTDH